MTSDTMIARDRYDRDKMNVYVRTKLSHVPGEHLSLVCSLPLDALTTLWGDYGRHVLTQIADGAHDYSQLTLAPRSALCPSH